MKIIFLDFDGVLNSLQQAIAMKGKGNPYSAENIDKVSLGLVKWVCDMTDARIVISSTWRSMGKGCIEGIFEAHGWRMPPIVGITPRSGGIRGDEIKSWMNSFPSIGGHTITDHVIIDDDSDMLDEQLSFFVQTDALVGFTLYDAMKCVDILGPTEDNKVTVEGVRTHVDFKKTKKIDF